ncbi:MAG: signal transduction histidine kinase [Vicingaceae bacterium]|jgi:signal transduction histidine kinase
MMQQFKSLYLLGIGLLFLVSCYVLPPIFQLSNAKTAEKIQELVISMQQKAETDLAELKTKLENGAEFNPKYDFNKNEKTFLVYEDDSLIFWTDDHSTFDRKELNSNKSCIISSNAIYLKTKIQSDNNTLYCLNLLQYRYPINNKSLQNSFSKKLDFPALSSINLTGGDSAVSIDGSKPDFYVNFKNHETSNSVLGFFIFLFLISIYFIFYIFPSTLKSNKLLVSIFLAFGVRLLLFFQLPSIFYELLLFQPKFFAINEAVPSLGDLLFHVLLLFYVLYQLRVSLSLTKSVLLSVFIQVASIALSLITIGVFHESVYSSQINFNFNNLFNLNYLSIIAFVSFSLLVCCNLILIDLAFSLAAETFNSKNYNWFIAGFFTLSILASLLVSSAKLELFWILPIVLLFAFRNHKSSSKNIFVVLLLLIYVSSVISFSISKSIEERKQLQQKHIAEKLAEERDPVAEFMFNGLQQEILQDQYLQNQANNYWNKQEEIDQYLFDTYFNGYWEKYQISFVLCAKEDLLLADGQETDCWNYFNRRLRLEGSRVSSSNLFQLNNYAGRIDYIAEIPILGDSVLRKLIIEFSTVYLNENEGYPELLIDEKTKVSSLSLDDYSFAVYNEKKLVYKTGGYNFSTQLKISELGQRSFYQYPSEDHQHFAYQKDKNVTILLSRKQYSFYDFLTSLAYILVITSCCFLPAAIGLKYFPFHVKLSVHDFSTKIQLFLIGSILTSLIFLAWGTTFYIKKQYQAKNETTLQEKLRSVNLELESKIGAEEFLAEELTDYVTAYLVKFSNVFYSDINLYTTRGELYATSRAELFDKGIKSKRMNPQALFALQNKNKAQWVQEETIGELSYLSAYIPFKNFDNEVIGYLNLPYFAKQGALEKEISNFLVSTLNIYVGIFALALLISVLLINQLSKPLLLIRQQISKLKLGSNIELIEWSSKDEIGALVQEYNRIAIELNESAEELAKNEREVAWREMAKQVAHEIKNPLTPMKLSIQHLQRSVNMDSTELKERIERTTTTLVEQIETLSNIATAFSSFAKLPSKELQLLDVIPILKNAVELYAHSLLIKLEVPENLTSAVIMGDKDQLLRVFNNVIKNAVQATENIESPAIKVFIEDLENYYLVRISDNGTGITERQAERIFEPNFTTKSSGTGLGLAMSKSIVDQMNGKITFTSTENVGTTFRIELPKA